MLKEWFRKFIEVVFLIAGIILALGVLLSPVIMWFRSHDDFGKIVSVIVGIIIYGILIFSEGKKEKIWIEDGYINYYAEIGSYFQKYITHTGKVISKKINIDDVTDICLNHFSIQHKAGEDLYYRLTVCSSEDSICYDGYEDDGFKEILQIFKAVYPRLSLKFKRELINYICNNDIESKKSDKFPISMYDDCFKLRVIRNPYVFGSKDKYLSCSWNELEAKLDEKNMTCMLCLDGYEYPIYNFGVKDRRLVWHRFDHYVLWEIINDLHRCRNHAEPIDSYFGVVAGSVYFANQSSKWEGKGVCFYDPNAEGETIMRFYKIARLQLVDLHMMEGPSSAWYSNRLCLGFGRDGYPVYTLTAQQRKVSNKPGMKYYNLIKDALVNEYGMKEDAAVEYLEACKNR